jgi:hypothetical protein
VIEWDGLVVVGGGLRIEVDAELGILILGCRWEEDEYHEARNKCGVKVYVQARVYCLLFATDIPDTIHTESIQPSLLSHPNPKAYRRRTNWAIIFSISLSDLLLRVRLFTI